MPENNSKLAKGFLVCRGAAKLSATASLSGVLASAPLIGQRLLVFLNSPGAAASGPSLTAACLQGSAEPVPWGL